jgi:DDE superfamily endonuclease
MWCVADLTPESLARMEEVLALYERPVDPRRPVICLDEKAVSLHAAVRPSRAMRPGHPARRDYDYRRCGTANLFCAIEPKAGRHFIKATPNRTAAQFAAMLDDLAHRHRHATTIDLVIDNLNTHCCKSLTDTYGSTIGKQLWERFTVHYTPKHGSWLNPAEIEISLVSRQCLGQRRIADLPSLRRATAAWVRRANRHRTTINWTFDRRKARRVFRYKKKDVMRSKT